MLRSTDRRLIYGTGLDCKSGPDFFIRDESSVQPRRLQTRDPRCLCGHAETGVTVVRACQRGGSFGLLTFTFSKACAQFIQLARIEAEPGTLQQRGILIEGGCNVRCRFQQLELRAREQGVAARTKYRF